MSSKKNVCKRCKLFHETSECPVCKIAQSATSWKGRLIILDHKNSSIAKKTGMEIDGEYAIKVN